MAVGDREMQEVTEVLSADFSRLVINTQRSGCMRRCQRHAKAHRGAGGKSKGAMKPMNVAAVLICPCNGAVRYARMLEEFQHGLQSRGCSTMLKGPKSAM